jgi:cell division protein FtsI (penicillin-binding protein 3)
LKGNKDILWRVYIIYLLICVFGISVVAAVVKIQFFEGDKWEAEANKYKEITKEIPAVRGNIYTDDGSLLATSIPLYEIRMDLKTVDDKLFDDNVDSLSYCLAKTFTDKSQQQYKGELIDAKRKQKRYHLIKNKIQYGKMKEAMGFPIFRMGSNKGGFIAERQEKRSRPFGLLAFRTVGYEREGGKVGIEGAYSDQLSGVTGKQKMRRTSEGYRPVGEYEVEPQNGSDIFTTIDINIQDVAESALMKQMQDQGADRGTVVLMEVETGYIKAIANLSREGEDKYFESYNNAIGRSTEPGSTFKLPSLVAGLEDDMFDITDSVETSNGRCEYYDLVMRDSKVGLPRKVTVEQAFAYSLNCGCSKLIYDSYSKNPLRYIKMLKNMGLHEKIGLDIAGEGKPLIKDPNDKDAGWSGVSLPQMAIGYEVMQTPLQILTFYNAIANNGVMMRPQLVREIRKDGNTVKLFNPDIMDPAICSKRTVKKAQRMLEAVVEYGTGKQLQAENYKMAGKTGTAQMAQGSYGYNKTHYQASFAGYFPADNPKYSCIVVISGPTKDIYGVTVSGTVFKDIADKVYATKVDMHNEMNITNELTGIVLPVSKNGHQKDLKTVFGAMKVKLKSHDTDAEWVATVTKETRVEANERVLDGRVPNVLGMGAMDAIYVLENQGLTVKLNGSGVVKKQSIAHGVEYFKGQQIILELM